MVREQALVCLSNREIVDARRGRTFHYPRRVNPVQKIPISKSRFKLATLVEIAADPGRNKGALQLLINRHGETRFARVHERVLTKSGKLDRVC